MLNPEAALDLKTVALRLAFAMAAGLLLGLERESHGRAAGLKTTVLACVASCLALIVSDNFYRESANAAGGMFRPDRARLAAGVLTGIGFLGAGAIIRQGTLVRGVTTAAVLWFITILGIAFGTGHLAVGVMGTAIAAFALFAMPRFESRIRRDFYCTVTVVTGLEGVTDEDVKRRLEATGARVQRIAYDYDLSEGTRTLQCELKLRRNEVLALSRQIVDDLAACPGILRVRWG
jgi:putative Mg2+ transporter-C (MgtC) family protein